MTKATELNNLLNDVAVPDQIKLLLEQTYQRTKGCGFDSVLYGLPGKFDMHSKLKAEPRRDKLKAQLLLMLAAESKDPGKFEKPAAPPIPAGATAIPILGVPTTQRQRHIKAAADAAAAQVENEDDPFLAELDKLKGKCFIDVHPDVEKGHKEYWEETRQIIEIKWREKKGDKRFVAVTKKFKNNGDLGKVTEDYGLSEAELPGMYEDIARYAERHGPQEALPAPSGAGPAAAAAL